MTRIALIFGSIAGLICAGMFFLTAPEDGFNAEHMENGEIIGYTTMIVSLSLIFLATRQYRDKQLGGSIKFGKALLLGLYISAVAGVIYVAGWELYQYITPGDFVDQYVAFLKQQLADQGMTPEQIETQMADQMKMMELYKSNFAFRMGLTFLEIFPVGLLISLISAILFGVVLKPKETTEQ